ncbi:MAG: glycosyltransferase, partial [Rhodovibrionaceae bacterium]|nr:glycosyltransferase [Rhodovibrionaceae bacterium]
LGAETIEAWAQARPVVSVNSPAGRVLIEHGSNGLLVPGGDGQALAEAIIALADDRASALHMALAGRQCYEASFGERGVVDAYGELFARLAREAPRGQSASDNPAQTHQGIEGSKNG